MTRYRQLRAGAGMAALLAVSVIAVVQPAAANGTTVTGRVVEVEHGHDPDAHHGPVGHTHDDASQYLLETAGGLRPLTATEGLQGGDTVVATLQGDVVQVTPAAPGDAVVGDLAPATHNLYVVLAVPAGGSPDPAVTLTTATAAVKSAAAYWTAQTGKLKFVVAKAQGSFQSTYGCGNSWGLWNEAAQKVGFPGGARNHLVVMLPRSAYQTGGCSYGLGTLGSPTSGGRVYAADVEPGVIAHELGHNLGLGHTGALWCPGTSDASLSAGTPAECSLPEYAEVFDVMSWAGRNLGRGTLHPRNLERLGLIDSAPTVTGASEARSVTLAPVSNKLAVNRGAKLVDAVSGDTYWVEYRVQLGADAIAAQTGYGPTYGVRVLKANPAATYGTAVLDATPTAPNDYDQVLRVGQPLTTTGGSTITLTAVDSVGATVRLAGPSAPPVAPPVPQQGSGAVVTLTLPTAPVAVGTPGVVKAKVVNRVGVPAAKALVWLQAEDTRGGLLGWRWVKSGLTGLNGEVALKVVPSAPGVRYRAIVPAGPVLGEELTSPLSAALPVTQPIGLTATPLRPTVGATVAFTVKTPGTSAADLDVEVRRLGETTWTPITRPAFATSVFRTSASFRSAGVWEARAVRRAAAGYQASQSAIVKVTVV